jgi:hypothetical protein
MKLASLLLAVCSKMSSLSHFYRFDTTDDDDDERKDDPAPLIPTPTGFTPDCSILDNASILFLNTNILLELRKEWRFLYSTRTHSRCQCHETFFFVDSYGGSE